MNLVLISVWNFAGPCWIVNILHTLIVPAKKWLPWLKKYDKPLDHGKYLWGNRILSDSITYAGIVVSLLAPFFLHFIFLQTFLVLLEKAITTYLGGVIASFIKRRLGYPRGSFLPFMDHGDYIIFTSIIFISVHQISFFIALISIFITYILHPAVCLIGYKLNMRTHPY